MWSRFIATQMGDAKKKRKNWNKGELKSVIAHYMLALAVSSMKK